MDQVDKLLLLAKNEVGTKEYPENSDNVKYNTAYYGRAVKSTASTKYYWCVVFIWWLFQQAGLSRLFYDGGKIASCGSLKTYAKQRGQWVTSGYRRGDLIMFNFSGKSAPQHIGICVEVNGSKITTIDGNTGAGESGSQDNGGMVQIRTRNVSCVVGAYRPKYEGSVDVAKIQTVTVNAPVLKKGVNHEAVKILQAYLNASGYNCGDVDGDFGTKTDAALRAFQKDHGLTVDGICGQKTWAAILCV